GRLADAALAAHDGDEAGTTVDPGTDAGLHGIALARGLTVAEVDEPAGHGVEDAAPGINGHRLADRAGLEQAVVGEHGTLLTGSGRLGLAGTACMRFDERRTLRAGDLLDAGRGVVGDGCRDGAGFLDHERLLRRGCF